MNLNDEQNNAVKEIITFLHNDEKFFNLSGPAGSGKTTIIRHLIENVFNVLSSFHKILGTKSKYTSMQLLATTNKAASELGSALSNAEVLTVHKFFGLIVSRDFSTGNLVCKTTRNTKIIKNTIIIIDEASMIDREVFNIIKDNTLDCKIIFVGDDHQLKAVSGGGIGSVYVRGFSIASLNTVMRTTKPELHALYAHLRASVMTHNPVTFQTSTGAVEHYTGMAAKDAVMSAFQNQALDARIVAYSNSRVLQWTDFLNTDVLKRGGLCTEGTTMVLGSAFQFSNNQRYYSEEEVFINKIFDVDLIKEPTGYGFSLEGRRAELIMRHANSNPIRTLIDTNRTAIKDMIKSRKSLKDWEAVDYLESRVIDLRFKESATVHKTQGSTYDEIYVDLSNLSLCKSEDTFYRLLYVACSRARNKVILLGNLDSKFGKII